MKYEKRVPMTAGEVAMELAKTSESFTLRHLMNACAISRPSAHAAVMKLVDAGKLTRKVDGSNPRGIAQHVYSLAK